MNSAGRIQSFQLFSAQGAVPSQEDCVLGRKERGLFVVADGFGGSVAGMNAARTACESVLNFLEKEAGDREATMPFVLRSYFSLAGNVLFNSLMHANAKVTKLNDGKGANDKGGASVVAGFIDDDLFALANIGSCSAWLIRNGEMKELVTPRSYARLKDPFAVDPSELESVPLTAMGVSKDLEPEIIEFQVRSGDVVLLQTDGVREEIRRVLMQNLSAGADELEKTLRGLSFSENASFALVRVA